MALYGIRYAELERQGKFIVTEEQYYDFIKPYEDALKILMARLNVLKHNLYGDVYQPVHTIQSRIKKKNSIEEKLLKKNMESSLSNAKDYLQDIAGTRIICYFVDDIYNLVHAIKKQTDLIFIRENDYISQPKPNGYRSYHIIMGIPVYCLDGMEYFPVEIQLRTMAMDLWASMEHRILYKKKREDCDMIANDLKIHAETLQEIEKRFEKYRLEP